MNNATTPLRILVGIGLAVVFVLAVLYGALICSPPRYLPWEAFSGIGIFILTLLGLSVQSWKTTVKARGIEHEKVTARERTAGRVPDPQPDGVHWESHGIRNPETPHPRDTEANPAETRRLLRQVSTTARPVGQIRTYALAAKRGPFPFGPSSQRQLATLHPDLQRVLVMASKYTNFTILEGERGKAAQDAAYAEGNSKLKYPCGNHNGHPSDAADCAPYPVDWSNAVNARDRFVYMAAVIMTCGDLLGVPLRWGGDWNTDQDMRDEGSFRDFPHIERRNPDYSTIIRCP